jgi:hypothetical protein
MYGTILMKKLGAGDVKTIGESGEEIDTAVAVIMGQETQTMDGGREPAQIVTLDQDLGTHKDGRRLIGTDIAAKLHEEGFQGLVCMLSGGSPADLDAYSKLPGVDLALSKSSGMPELTQAISDGYWAKVESNSLNASSSCQ